MLSSNHIAIRLALVGWLAVSQTRAGFFNWFTPPTADAEPTVQDYNVLNILLVDYVREETAVPNLRRAAEWLKMSTGQIPLEPYDLVLPRRSALVQFTSLLELLDQDESGCDLAAHEILKNNEKTTGAHILVEPEELGALRRIESVIYEVALAHARLCRYEYPDLFALALLEAPPRTLHEIRSMMGAVIKSKRTPVMTPKNRYTDPRQVDAQRARFVTMDGMDEALALLTNVRRRARNDPDVRYLQARPDQRNGGRWIVHEPKVVEMLDKYVYSRCEFIKRSFDHILRPAQYEQNLYSRNYKYRAINDQTGEIMIWLQYDRICRDISAKRRTLEDNIIKIIWIELKQNKG